MGCIASRIEEEERVRICKERRKLMKELVVFRRQFADSLMGYLRALRNTGVTLGQFTESESLSLEAADSTLPLPPSPPLPLPPSPPPPPPFSPDSTNSTADTNNNLKQHQSAPMTQCDTRGTATPPPPPETSSSSSWNYWDPFQPNTEIVESDSWAETKTYFDDDDDDDGKQDDQTAPSGNIMQQQLHLPVELVDDNSSDTKDTADMAMVQWRSKKTLEAIMRNLDDYFLKASAGGNEIALLMDISRGDTSLAHSSRERNRSDSAKVFSALSWSSRSSRSLHLQLTKDAAELCSTSEPCKPGAHCITLEKLYAAEQKLYKDVKEEEITKLEFRKKSMLLVKLEQENQDWNKTEKMRLSVEELESDLTRLKHSISGACSSISQLINMELYPQLIALVSGLKNTWRTMYECHQLQHHISQQLNHLTDSDNQGLESTDFHLQATAQLETEITSWYRSFCKLVKSQQQYVTTLSRWIQLTSFPVDDKQHPSAAVDKLCQEWMRSFDKLPDKVASEAIKGFLSAIQSIMQQQSEELSLQRKSEKLERRVQKELISLAELQKRLEWSIPEGDTTPNLSPKHPLSVKLVKTEDLKKRAETEKAKSLNSAQVTRAMTLNNLKTSLPLVFQALMKFSSAYAQALKAVQIQAKPPVVNHSTETSINQD
ncbi:Protein ALTERED PHOSPHATE STARVATION RESPONSE 1 [Linum grandiflorum]